MVRKQISWLRLWYVLRVVPSLHPSFYLLDFCADVASHVYQLSYESWTDWSKFYADAPEILEYWKRVADKYDVRKHVKLSHKCTEAVWDESRSKWIVRLLRSDLDEPVVVEDEADVLITGTGLLNQWKWPDISGLHDFKGELLHTANWNDNFDPTVSTSNLPLDFY